MFAAMRDLFVRIPTRKTCENFVAFLSSRPVSCNETINLKKRLTAFAVVKSAVVDVTVSCSAMQPTYNNEFPDRLWYIKSNEPRILSLT